jgi:CheY-like chemotaxis protein
MQNAPRLLGIISDLYFVSRLQEAAKAFACEVDWLDAPETEAEFVRRLEKNRPSLIVLDLNTGLPWPHWLPLAKANPTTAGIPWLAFGSHMNPRRLAAARHAGADHVVPKSQFDAELRKSLGQLANPLK